MPRRVVANRESRQRITDLRAKGLTLKQIGARFGLTKQGVQYALRAADGIQVRGGHRIRRRVRCRVCDGEINPAGALPRDDRTVLCLACLAKNPDATLGQHVQAFRLAAGLKIVALAKRSGVKDSIITAHEHGKRESMAWSVQRRLFRALGVRLVMEAIPNTSARSSGS